MEEPGFALFLFGTAIVLLVVIAGLIILILRMIPAYKKARDNALAAEKHAEQINADYLRAGFRVKKGVFVLARVTGVQAGVAFTEKVYSGSRSTLPRAVVSVPSALRGEFTITRGRSIEAKTGDATFDSEFHLQSKSREFLQAIFVDAHNRDAVRALFKLGFDRVELGGGEVSARKLRERHLIDLPIVTDAVARLAGLHNTPGIAGIAPYRRGITRNQIPGFILVSVILAITLGICASIWTRPLVDGWWGAALREWRTVTMVAAALAAAAAVTLRGRAYELYAVISFCLPALVFGGWCAAVLANQYLDDSAILAKDVQLLNKYTRRSRGGGMGYYLVFKSWRQNLNYDVDLRVPQGIYERLKPGDTASIGMRSGRLGIGWVDSVDGLTL